ncbi:hypothetical protein PUNSTDRAFT_145914 [Punctularia strigosozonata HHB-11173 SS5]|uniref:uncharacterized protein n=1 Tax=Punctularia strigosozonata (strain HHB-11173) TaxID=741275 RepID=UPI0004417818|nr:uncharacterized protein PUNSTDRAFT_145914 [Punctularia strigosozonata HHB-11173 SS5]EIN05495.1 hypothetical protein PUNSTDRAFT_145914 [Punctularia strigosozonata HHB-11173 SS5]
MDEHRAGHAAEEIDVALKKIDVGLRDLAGWGHRRSLTGRADAKRVIDDSFLTLQQIKNLFHIQPPKFGGTALDLAIAFQRDNASFRALRRASEKNDASLSLPSLTSHASPEATPSASSSVSKETQVISSLPSSHTHGIPEDGTTPPEMEHPLRRKLYDIGLNLDLTGQVRKRHEFPAVLSGGNGDVYEGIWLDNVKVALKFPRSMNASPRAKERFLEEAALWSRLLHPDIVPFYGIAFEGDFIYSVSQWMDNGPCLEYIKRTPDANRLGLLEDVTSGMEFLHVQKVVHGDLRAANVLINREGKAKLCDFGLSKVLQELSRGARSSLGLTNYRWLAPELMYSEIPVFPSNATDVFSFAMLCLELITEEPPYADMNDFQVVIALGQNKQLPARPATLAARRWLSDQLWTLMEDCWNLDPPSRPAARNIKSKLHVIAASHQVAANNRTLPIKIPSRPSTEHDSFPDFSEEARVYSSITPAPVGYGQPNHLRFPSISVSPADKEAIPCSSPEGMDSLPLMESPHMGALALQSLPSPSSQPLTLHVNPDGTIAYGSLDGLCIKLIADVSDVDFRWTFLATYRAFWNDDHGASNALFRYLRSTFWDGTGYLPLGMTRYAALTILKDWILSHYAEAEPPLLVEIADFAREASRSYPDLKNLADEMNRRVAVLQTAPTSDTASSRHPSASPLSRSPDSGKSSPLSSSPLGSLLSFRSRPKGSQTEGPHAVQARALTFKQASLFSQLNAGHYSAQLVDKSGNDDVKRFLTTEKKLYDWARQAILSAADDKKRDEEFRRFFKLAEECQKLQNFSVLGAIISALESPQMRRLVYTRSCLSGSESQAYDAMTQVILPDHMDARLAAGACIPWLSSHLDRLAKACHDLPPTTISGGAEMINWTKWRTVAAGIRTLCAVKPPEVEHDARAEDALVQIEKSLAGIKSGSALDKRLETLSLGLAPKEAKDHEGRKRELGQMGFSR